MGTKVGSGDCKTWKKLLIHWIVADHCWRFTRNARQTCVLLGVGACLKMERFFFNLHLAAPCLSGARRPH